jgi:hypothetical protein
MGKLAHRVKRANMIFNLDFISVPLNFDIMEQIFDTISKNRIAFHVMNIGFLEKLVKSQKTNVAISCSRNNIIPPDDWRGPEMDMSMNDTRARDPRKNIVVKLKGFLNYGSDMDLWTAPDEFGNRWITDMIGGNPIVEDGMQTIIDALQEYKQKTFSMYETDYEGAAIIPKAQKLKMEKEYMDEAKKLFVKNKDALIRDMKKVLSQQKVTYNNAGDNYDEFVISNYKIEAIAIPTSSSIQKQTIAKTIKAKYKLEVVDYGPKFFNLKGDGI